MPGLKLQSEAFKKRLLLALAEVRSWIPELRIIHTIIVMLVVKHSKSYWKWARIGPGV